MIVSRRLLLGSLLGGASLTMAGASLAMPSNRYQVLVEMQKSLYEANSLARSFLPSAHEDAKMYYHLLTRPNGISDQIGALVEYLLSEFNHTDLSNPEVVKSVTETLFGSGVNRIDALSEDELARVEDAVVAITVFNHALNTERVQFSPQTLVPFHTFTDRYDMIRQPFGRYFWARPSLLVPQTQT